jgi:hypothetical protein
VGLDVVDSVVEVLRIRELVGSVRARRGASASAVPAFVVVVRVVRLVMVLDEILIGLGLAFGEADKRGRITDDDGFLGVTFILGLSPPRVSISTV